MRKQLSDMTLGELWALFPIVLKEHNTEYAEWYETQRQKLAKDIPNSMIKRISHIGSSAVKGLISKPTVDILLEVNSKCDMEMLKKMLTDSGWVHMSTDEQPVMTISFNKGYTTSGFAEKVYHLHVRRFGDWDELYFRDYLIEHCEAAEEYGKLKLALLEEYRNDRDGYTEAKSDFIKEYTKKAREEFGGRYK
jgi:GrpB-like predicted nucleotidyltransferase (UPF0157 family)